MTQVTLAVVAVLALTLFGCITRTATMVEFETGEVLKGEFKDSLASDGSATVTMPDGEVLTGRYSGVRGTDEITFSTVTGSATAYGAGGSASAGVTGIGTQRTTGGQGKAYALLTSTKPGSKLVMEIIVIYNVNDGHGFGEAHTNDGRVYKVQF